MKKEYHNVAVAELWTKHYELCSFTNRSEEFAKNVYNFFDCLIDLDNDKKAIYTKVNRYYTETYLPELDKIIKESTDWTTDESSIKHESIMIERGHIRHLFRKIIQTIQDSGVAWQSGTSGGSHYVGPKDKERFTGEHH